MTSSKYIPPNSNPDDQLAEEGPLPSERQRAKRVKNEETKELDLLRKQLNQALAEQQKLEKEKAKYLEIASRAQKDLKDIRRRQEREGQDHQKQLIFLTLQAFLPVMDSFEVALENSNAATDLEGFRMIYKKLIKSLEQLNIESFSPTPGTRFDPTCHEALQAKEQENFKPGVIIQTISHGYRWESHLLRPARVVVSK